MASCYFAPNTRVTGGALFVSFSSKDGAVFFKLLKQIANNPSKKGNFDGQHPINLKLSEDEAAGIIRAVRTRNNANFYHKFKDTNTAIHFTHYKIEPKQEGDKAREGFGLTVKQTVGSNPENVVKVGFSLDSAERLLEYLRFALNHIFSADYSLDKKRALEFAKQREQQDAPPSEPSDSSQESNSEPVGDTSDLI
jgi:hypothetical protein